MKKKNKTRTVTVQILKSGCTSDNLIDKIEAKSISEIDGLLMRHNLYRSIDELRDDFKWDAIFYFKN